MAWGLCFVCLQFSLLMYRTHWRTFWKREQKENSSSKRHTTWQLPWAKKWVWFYEVRYYYSGLGYLEAMDLGLRCSQQAKTHQTTYVLPGTLMSFTKWENMYVSLSASCSSSFTKCVTSSCCKATCQCNEFAVIAKHSPDCAVTFECTHKIYTLP